MANKQQLTQRPTKNMGVHAHTCEICMGIVMRKMQKVLEEGTTGYAFAYFAVRGDGHLRKCLPDDLPGFWA